ncbi:MAG: 4Fe-4S dicluster domain-containing protein [Methanobacteriota archaeon]|nr:MAG: 4Fe-4S dicluster domain-containing protein [Euryarchaeota archaeon]
MGFEFVIDEKLCIGCGNCVVVCPVDAFNSMDIAGGKGANLKELTRRVADGRAVQVDRALCNGCGTCVQNCPTDALIIVSDAPEESVKLVEGEALDLVGVKADIYRLLKERSLTIPQIAEELGIGTREVFLHLMALKREDRVFEGERVGGRFAYTTEPPKPPVVEEKEAEEAIVIDEKRAEEIRKKLEAAMASFGQSKVRLMIETNKLERALEVVTNKPKKGGEEK